MLLLLGHPRALVSGRRQDEVIKAHVEKSMTKALTDRDNRLELIELTTSQITAAMDAVLEPLRGDLANTASFAGSEEHLRRLNERLPTIRQVVDNALREVTEVLAR